MADLEVDKVATQGEKGLSALLNLLPPLPSLESLRLPELSQNIASKSAELIKYKDVFYVLQHALTEQVDPSAPKLETVIKELFKNNETYKLLGLDQVSDAKIKETAEKVRELSKTHANIDDIHLITEVASLTHKLVADLPKQDRLIIVQKIAEEGFDYLGIGSENKKVYAQLISTLISNADPKHLDVAIDFAIKVSNKHNAEISPVSIAGIFLGDQKKLSEELGLSVEKVKEAQTCIADAFAKSIQEHSGKLGLPMNMHTLTALLNPRTPLTLVDNQGQYSQRNLDAVANLATCNMLDHPRTGEEYNLRREATQTRESEHQKGVRNEAHMTINNTRMGIIPFMHRIRQARAHGIANQWTPGFQVRGLIMSQVTDGMNTGYKGTINRANSEMRETVFSKIKTQVSHSFSSLSPADQSNLKSVSKIFAITSNQSYSPEIRVDDLKQLDNLGRVARSILDVNPTTEIDPTRITKYSNQSGENGERYDVFVDTQTKATYYRLTETDGKIKFAKSTDPGKYIFVNEKDYSGVFKSLSIYEERLNKVPGQLSKIASTNKVEMPAAPKAKDEKLEAAEKIEISPSSKSTPEGLVEITDTIELQKKYSFDPKNPSVKIDFNNFKVFSYQEQDGSTSYALIKKNDSVTTRSIRNNQLQDYILSDVLKKIQNS